MGLQSFLQATVILLICATACGAQVGRAPDNSRQTALVLEQLERNAEAEVAWRSWLRANPASSEAYAHLGLLEARQEHFEDAIPLYRKALALHAGIPGLQLDLGIAYFRAGELKEALQEFIPLLKETPESSPDRQRLVILVAMCNYGLERYSQAAPYLEEAVSHDPQNLQMMLALAHSYLWSKQYQKVLDTYRVILQINAESAEADMLAGEALDEMNNAFGAIEQFRAAVNADPKLPDAHFGLGFLLWTEREYTEAAQEFQTELDNNPHHAQALTYLADCDMRLRNPAIAIPLLEKAIRIDPGIELAHLDLGLADADSRRLDDALRELKTAAKLTPGDVKVHWRLGRLYQEMGHTEEAKAEFDKTKRIKQAADAAQVNKMNSNSESTQSHPSSPAGK